MQVATQRPTDGAAIEKVVLLDPAGRAMGSQDKRTVHHAQTPLHLGFSCYVFDNHGRVLLTRRALHKATFPGVWTNSVCGHPAPGETLGAAVLRRVRRELGLPVGLPRLVLPDFAYRAEMGGVVENELCPVLVTHSLSGSAPRPDPDEVADLEWVDWADFVTSVETGARPVSPWCAEQLVALAAVGDGPVHWPDGHPELLPEAVRW